MYIDSQGSFTIVRLWGNFYFSSDEVSTIQPLILLCPIWNWIESSETLLSLTSCRNCDGFISRQSRFSLSWFVRDWNRIIWYRCLIRSSEMSIIFQPVFHLSAGAWWDTHRPIIIFSTAGKVWTEMQSSTQRYFGLHKASIDSCIIGVVQSHRERTV